MIEATLCLADAAARHWQFIVIGAGPAGSATAIRLARAGHAVLLVDRAGMPRPKVCGCCLSPTALRELASLGAPAGCGPTPVPLTAVHIVAGGRAARLAMRGGATLSREVLDTMLVEQAIAAGAHWLPHLTVTSLTDTATSVCLTARAADAAGSTVVIAGDSAVIAAGLADHIRVDPSQPQAGGGQPRRWKRSVAAASRVGIGTTLPATAADLHAGELVMAVGRRGYVGIVRLEDGRIDLAAAIDRQTLAPATRPADAIAALLVEAVGTSGLRVSAAALQAADFRATPALTHRSPLSAGTHERIFRVGDAAGYVEPFTGEGMGWALANARIFAEAVHAAETQPTVATAYSRAHAGLFAAHHARCRGVARAVRHPWLVSGAVRMARLLPRLAAGIVPLLIGADRAGCAA